jgi:hypothetical protein
MRSAITAPTHIRTVEQLRKNSDTILNGTWIAIDPASISMGYALVEGGNISKNGTFSTKKKPIGERLKDLHSMLDLELPEVELMVVEFVRTGTGHHFLTWSTGLAVGALGAKITIEIPTSLWAKGKDANYIKSDACDAKYIAKFCLAVCEDTSL